MITTAIKVAIIKARNFNKSNNNNNNNKVNHLKLYLATTKVSKFSVRC